MNVLGTKGDQPAKIPRAQEQAPVWQAQDERQLPGALRPHAVTGVTGVTGPASFNPGTYAYDDAGNMTTRPGQQATVNEVGKVSKVVTGTKTQTNVYHADGSLLLRMSSTEGASLTVGDTVLSQAVGSSVVAGFRTYSGTEGKPVAQRSAKTGTTGTTMTWLFTNLEGSVDTQTVANTGVTERNYRDPYGAPITMAGGAWADGSGYMNKQVTASSALTTVGARTYDPVLGKFLSVDPVIDANLPQQNTGYTYSGNNPTTYSDPSGMKFAIDAPVAGGSHKPSSRAKQSTTGVLKSSSNRPVVRSATVPQLSRGNCYAQCSVAQAEKATRAWQSSDDKSILDGLTQVVDGINQVTKTVSNVIGATARAIRNLPLSTIGAIVAIGSGAECQGYEYGLLLCSTNSFAGTITLGNLIVTSKTHERFAQDVGLSEHEISHSTQSAIMGNDLYALVWLGGLGPSHLFGQYQQGGGGCLNPIERSAAPGGGYESC